MDQQPLLLVVEDHPISRNILRTIFIQRGWRVETASTVEEGLYQLGHREEPDWLFLDLMLPDGKGETILKFVKDQGLRTRVVVMTAVYDLGRLKSVAELNPDAIVQKPINLDEVFEFCELPTVS